VDLRGNPEVLIDGPVAELEFENLIAGIICNGGQQGRFDSGKRHDRHFPFDSCGFLFRFRSPSAAAIWFQRLNTVPSGTAGVIAPVT
jgi:hypothetical protein